MFRVSLRYNGRNHEYEQELARIRPFNKIIPNSQTTLFWLCDSENEADRLGQALVQFRKFGSTVRVKHVNLV